MEPENPPRRPKPDHRPDHEPVTIDLEASHEGAETEPTVDDVEKGAESHRDHETDPVTSETAIVEETGAAASDARAETLAEDRAETAAAAFTEEPAPSERRTAERPESVAAQPSRSGALAAGILGGLIALVGAGVLQYSGLVPAIGPAKTTQSGAEGAGRDLAGELDALKAQLGATANGDTSPLQSRIETLEQTIGVADQGGDAAALRTQVETLNQDLAALRSQLAEQKQSTEAETSQLATRIDEAEKKLDEPASDIQLARAIAVTALKTAIDRGGPFLAELDALKSVSPDDLAVAGLADVAPRGVASRADLTRDFPDAADAMLAAVRGADPNQGMLSRLIGSAASAIRVRPVGSVEGTGPEAVIARIESKLTNGDLKGASLEWDALPQPAKDAGAGFRSALDERLKVEGLIDTAVSGAVSGTAKPNQG